MRVRTFILSEKDLASTRMGGGFTRWLGKNKLRQYSLRKGEVPLTSVHHLVQKLLLGKNVFEHFLPKQEQSWLVAVLADKKHVHHPYSKLIDACYQFLIKVPDNTVPKDSYSWQRISGYVRGMESIRSGFKSYVTDEMLIRLRPHVETLFKELTAHIRR